MFVFLTVILSVLYTFTTSEGQFLPELTKSFCDPNEETCLSHSATTHYRALFRSSRNTSIGLESLDPMQIDIVHGDFSHLEYFWYNPTVHGLRKCYVQNVKLSFQTLRMHFDLACPRLDMYGYYQSTGNVLNAAPIDGEGQATLTLYDYLIKVDGTFAVVEHIDKRSYLFVDNYYTQYIPRGAALLDLENLYIGRADLANSAQNLINERAKEVVMAYQNPFFDAVMRKVMANANTYLSTIPIDELFYQFTSAHI